MRLLQERIQIECFLSNDSNDYLPCDWAICEDHLKNGEISNCRFCKKQHKYEPNQHINIKVLTLLKREKAAKHYLSRLKWFHVIEMEIYQFGH